MLIAISIPEELLKQVKTSYIGDFDGQEEKAFVENIYEKFGLNGLEMIYNSLEDWDSKSNFIKYFLREDCIISDNTLLHKFQTEYFEYLIEQGHIISYCGKI